ncbi:hypothetical protein K491DRAFT_433694 [Lophiostoma macrostomum CBS 122681]|uniref:Ubiquitin-like domain-containing protein n=1 Tax=Lophiostoma macrostomum CBS 122681 TaxID=1314788 RepID=A0A6A6T8Q4_9PLEO|nr:hypothetical protein K491DRAFT_433694 [Lophiostoma macrostomum CBS 122681]
MTVSSLQALRPRNLRIGNFSSPAMSFGFSVGDFLAAGNLVIDIVTILRTSARAEYQELILELHGLKRALEQIERLKAPPEQEYAVNSIKVAALMCTHVLDEFAGKLKRFEIFSSHQTQAWKIRIWKEKLRWGFTMADEVRNLRAYLAAHVGSLNMRLVTEGLSSSYLLADRAQATADETNGRMEASQAMTHGIQSTLQRLASVLTEEVVPQIKALALQVSRVWQTNTHIISILVRMQEAPVPALQHTWFQTPVKFEDALGRVFPIPSEFDWPKIIAIIEVHFAEGPGHQKIAAGEYELFDPLNRNEVISPLSFEGLRPGMSLTLAFVIGKYHDAIERTGRCPRPGCRSQSIRTQDDGAKECIACGVCFENTRKALPLPYRKDSFSFLPDRTADTCQLGKRKRATSESGDSLRYKQARTERMRFKNIRISPMPLPPTPSIRNVRRVTRSTRQATSNGQRLNRPIAEQDAPLCTESNQIFSASSPDQNSELRHSKYAGEPSLRVPDTAVQFRKPKLPVPNASLGPISHIRTPSDLLALGRLTSSSAGAYQYHAASGPFLHRSPSPAFTCYSASPLTIRYSSSFSARSSVTPSVFSEPWHPEDKVRYKERHTPEIHSWMQQLMSSGPTPPISLQEHLGAVKLNSGLEIRDASKKSRSSKAKR